MIDFNKVQSNIVRICSILVGDDLSKIGEEPAIIREYGSVVKPEYPYLMFDITELGDLSGGLRTSEFFDEVTGKYKVQSIHEVSIRFSCYGDSGKAIISKLYSGLSRPSVRKYLNKYIPELALNRIKNIRTVQTSYETQYITHCSFTVLCRYVNTEVDPFELYIDDLGLKLQVYGEENNLEFEKTYTKDSMNNQTNNIIGNP